MFWMLPIISLQIQNAKVQLYLCSVFRFLNIILSSQWNYRTSLFVLRVLTTYHHRISNYIKISKSFFFKSWILNSLKLRQTSALCNEKIRKKFKSRPTNKIILHSKTSGPFSQFTHPQSRFKQKVVNEGTFKVDSQGFRIKQK